MTACPFCGDDLLARIEPSKPSQLVACTACLNVSIVRWEDSIALAERIPGVDSAEDIAPPGSVMEGVFKLLNDAIAEMPAAPEISRRIIAILHDPISSMSDMAKVINEDAAISLRVLRMANSAYYAAASEITDLQNACARLGMKTIANIAHAVSNESLFRGGAPEFKEIMQQLRLHGVATAHCAEQLIGLVQRKLDPSLPFVAGLVHDTGKLVLLDILTSKYSGNIGRLRESPELMVRVLNRFYPLVGLHVVQYWRMPMEIGFSTFFNNKPNLNPEDERLPLINLIALSSALAESCGYGVGKVAPADIAVNPAIEALGISADAFTELSAELPEQIDNFVQVLGPT